MKLLEVAWYSIVFFASGSWLLSKLIADTVPNSIRTVLGVVVLVLAIASGYLMVFDRPLDPDCSPSGPSIYNTC